MQSTETIGGFLEAYQSYSNTLRHDIANPLFLAQAGSIYRLKDWSTFFTNEALPDNDGLPDDFYLRGLDHRLIEGPSALDFEPAFKAMLSELKAISSMVVPCPAYFGDQDKDFAPAEYNDAKLTLSKYGIVWPLQMGLFRKNEETGAEQCFGYISAVTEVSLALGDLEEPITLDKAVSKGQPELDADLLNKQELKVNVKLWSVYLHPDLQGKSVGISMGQLVGMMIAEHVLFELEEKATMPSGIDKTIFFDARYYSEGGERVGNALVDMLGLFGGAHPSWSVLNCGEL